MLTICKYYVDISYKFESHARTYPSSFFTRLLRMRLNKNFLRKVRLIFKQTVKTNLM